MDNHQYPPQCVEAQRDKALFAHGVRVFDSKCHFIPKCLFGMRETHTMFAKIGARLARVELELHTSIMHILYI